MIISEKPCSNNNNSHCNIKVPSYNLVAPYSDIRYCVDRYDSAARKFLGKPAEALKWGTKIEFDGVMDLVTVEDAVEAFERYIHDHRL